MRLEQIFRKKFGHVKKMLYLCTEFQKRTYMATQIKFDERNYRKHSKKNKAIIKKSLSELGAGRSILLDNEDSLIAGNGVYEQAQALGIPVRVIETDGSELIAVKRTDLQTADEKRRKLALADNVASDLSEFDVPALQADWSKDALADWGVELPEIEEAEPKDAQEDDFDEEKDKVETVCKKGDIWQLGQHRLMCGDSTSREDCDALMAGNKAQLALTDPPYGINIVKHGGKIGGAKPFGSTHGKAKNAILEPTKYAPIIGDATTETAEKSYKIMLEVTDNQILFGGNYFTEFLPPHACWIVWDKKNTGSFADVELAWTSFDKGAKLYAHLWNGLCREGKRDVECVKRVHPTQKPDGMLGNILKDFTKEQDSVLDLFGGSGSTLIACEQLGRKCYMMELDPHYCDVIIARWEKLTGQTATKL